MVKKGLQGVGRGDKLEVNNFSVLDNEKFYFRFIFRCFEIDWIGLA